MCRLAGPVTNETISPPRRYGLANVPFVIQRPCHLAWSGHRPVSGDVVLPKLSKLLYQEGALSAPCQPVILLSADAPRQAQMLRGGVIRRF